MGVIISFEEAKKLAEKKRKERLETEELGSITDAVLDHDFLLQELYNRLAFYEKALETGNLLYLPEDIFYIHNGKISKGKLVNVKYYKQAPAGSNLIYSIATDDMEPGDKLLDKIYGTSAFNTEEEARVHQTFFSGLMRESLKDEE